MSAVFSGIDFESTGKQIGYGHVVHSDQVHDGSVIPVPIAVISSGPGPTTLLVAGTHGDEYEGQVLLHELIRIIEPEDLAGTLIIVPAANSAAVRAGMRVSPIDGGNLNRSYPGDARGGPTEQVADMIAGSLLPRADFVIDMHSGGVNSTYLPITSISRGPDAERWKAKLAAVRALGLPYAMVAAPLLEIGSISNAADRAGIPTISTELAGSGTMDRRTLKNMRRGVDELLRSLGVLRSGPEAGGPADPEPVEPVWIELTGESPVTSTAVGLFEPLVDLGDWVTAGDPVAQVHFIDELDREPRTYAARVDGVVAIMRRPTLVDVGAHLMHIAPMLDISAI
ncbi:succinylglutamate desuccinylase/aspartoacylase family protein [Paeniglutamicibacter cryotolerans]|uniref:Putative deacylase n=1 Tax=Paeniglutamicibacter cryotolerans TaxID=670079 RepID=A0A839QE04_9MICC|nr:succinylglutamate desuccinylase/aspartoacylase family protein [Paeniglutamicibacter cryotolerans]MBB2994140.1 putative deacylase [Paeniglutamicibacter cryotolerans]